VSSGIERLGDARDRSISVRPPSTAVRLAVAPARFVRPHHFETITGYTVEAIQTKIKRGVWLEGREFVTGLLRDRCKIGVDLGQRRAAVDRGFALPEQVQVGAVEDEQLGQGRAHEQKGRLVWPSCRDL